MSGAMLGNVGRIARLVFCLAPPPKGQIPGAGWAPRRPVDGGVDHYVETADLLEVVQGYSGSYDEEAAKRGIEWMRAIDRREGRTPKF